MCFSQSWGTGPALCMCSLAAYKVSRLPLSLVFVGPWPHGGGQWRWGAQSTGRAHGPLGGPRGKMTQQFTDRLPDGVCRASSRTCVPVMPYKGDILQWAVPLALFKASSFLLQCCARTSLLDSPFPQSFSDMWVIVWITTLCQGRCLKTSIPPRRWSHFYLYFLIKQTEGYYLWCRPHMVYIFIIGSLIWFLIIIHDGFPRWC